MIRGTELEGGQDATWIDQQEHKWGLIFKRFVKINPFIPLLSFKHSQRMWSWWTMHTAEWIDSLGCSLQRLAVRNKWFVEKWEKIKVGGQRLNVSDMSSLHFLQLFPLHLSYEFIMTGKFLETFRRNCPEISPAVHWSCQTVESSVHVKKESCDFLVKFSQVLDWCLSLWTNSLIFEILSGFI